MTKTQKKAFKAFQTEYAKQINDETEIDNLLDIGSMKLIAELDQAYLILYNEGIGLGGFLNVVFKYDRRMETVEIF